MKIILIEDNLADAVLIERQINKILAFPKVLHITKFQEFENAIDNFNPDIILCDYQLRGFTGLEVLEYIQSLAQDIPFIFITGTINDEELAANTILTGATGYILKKNINLLHEKLLPHFRKIITSKEELIISSKHRKVFEEMRDYLEHLASANCVDRASFHEVERVWVKIQSLNSKNDQGAD